MPRAAAADCHPVADRRCDQATERALAGEQCAVVAGYEQDVVVQDGDHRADAVMWALGVVGAFGMFRMFCAFSAVDRFRTFNAFDTFDVVRMFDTLNALGMFRMFCALNTSNTSDMLNTFDMLRTFVTRERFDTFDSGVMLRHAPLRCGRCHG
ncbi:MAG TPA: hypothetical protein VHV99_18855 [Paraburkholderia sp.]|nr:hypothetical protein [Paraburkholderia sp.]